MDQEKFKLFLARKGLKQSTIKGDVDVITRLLKTSTLDDIDNYLLGLVSTGRKHSYLNSIVKALRNYGDFIGSDTLKTTPFFKRQETNKSTMQDKEIEDFLNLYPPNFIAGKYLWHYNKMTMFWRCLAFSGGRTGEIANLRINDVDFGRTLFLVDGKMGKRSIPISHTLIDPLKAHINQLKGNYLFPSMRNKRPIERATWGYDFQQRIKRLGIKRDNLTPYSFRHSFATRLLSETNVNVFQVQKLLGHKDLKTTQIYTHMTTKDMQKTIAKDPMSRKSADPHEVIKQLKEAIFECIADDDRFRHQITEDGLELVFKIEFLKN